MPRKKIKNTCRWDHLHMVGMRTTGTAVTFLLDFIWVPYPHSRVPLIPIMVSPLVPSLYHCLYTWLPLYVTSFILPYPPFATSSKLETSFVLSPLPLDIVVQSLSYVHLFATPWTAARQASLSFTISRSLLKLMSIESVIPSNHLILSRTLLLLPSIFPSIRVFSNESALCISWPKYWSFSISPSNEYSGSISFRIEWFDLLSVRGTLKSLLQHHNSKASVLWHSWFPPFPG